MSSKNSETGHEKNVENFELLIVNCTGFGARYNPKKSSLKLSELSNKLSESQGTLGEVNTYLPPHTLAIDRREKAFLPLQSLSTRIEGSVASSDADEATLKDLKTITRKLKGTRAVAKKKAKAVDPSAEEATSEASTNGETISDEPNYGSSSQMGYDNRIGHTDKLVKFLITIGHDPNEEDLTVGSVKAIHDEMKASNTEVKTLSVPLKTARNSRDKSIYDPKTGLIARAKAVKEYVKAVFGFNSPEYKAIQKIKFTQKRY
jgi:hypothetical protein